MKNTEKMLRHGEGFCPSGSQSWLDGYCVSLRLKPYYLLERAKSRPLSPELSPHKRLETLPGLSKRQSIRRIFLTLFSGFFLEFSSHRLLVMAESG